MATNAPKIRLSNLDTIPFTGWIRTTVDAKPEFDAGFAEFDYEYRLARQIGEGLWAVDVHASLASGERREIDLGECSEGLFAPPRLPDNPIAHFGGVFEINNAPARIVSLRVDGASWLCKCEERVSPMLFVEAWLRWRPDEPGIVTGEVLTTCSNGSIPDMGAIGGVRVRFGDSACNVLGKGWTTTVIDQSTEWADGQARAVPVVFLWQRHINGAEQFSAAAAAVNRTANAVGVGTLWPDGNPAYPASFNAAQWGATHWEEAKRRLHTWEPGVVGPNPASGDTGAQEDQVFVRGEALLPDGVGCEQIAYLSALKLFARPCHHREADGRLADPLDHPNCVFWSGRPHFNDGVSPDKLGKVGTLPDTHGWSGPDREHWLYNTVAAAARLVDSPALQRMLEQQARLFLFGETVKPGWSTSGRDAARSIGWAGIIAVHLWRGLEDRGLAARVRQRYLERWTTAYAPLLDVDIWDIRTDDPRLGPGQWWLPWQQAVGAYGLDLAGQVFDIPGARIAALRGAQAVLREAWVQVGDRWQSRPQMPVAGGGNSDEVFNYFGMSMAVAAVLRHLPSDQKASAIWQQLQAGADEAKETAWLAPGVSSQAVPPQMASSVTDRGVTWTFDKPYQVGQFITGDWWVVGPVIVTAISPGLQTANGRTTGGSMLNPNPMANLLSDGSGRPSGRQGYDSKLFDPYLGDENGSPRWAPSLSLQLPATITTGSIVSTVPFFGTPPDGQTSVLKTARVLTVLSAVPPPDAFRPPYAGTDKSIPATAADIDWTALASLAPAPGMPDMDALLARFKGSLWLDHFPSWTSRYMHPVDGLPDYYRGFTTAIGNAALYANSTASQAQRKPFVIALAQMGLDNHRHMQLGAVWGVNGHCNGRKFPILFAGKVLGKADMLAAGVTYAPTMTRPKGPGVVPFSEDGQTFYVQQTSPGVINWGVGNYLPADIGIAEWGNFHLTGSPTDYREWANGAGDYRRCCSANGWAGVTLAMRAMGLRDAWNQPAYFDYMDRYMQTEPAGEWTRSWEPWQGRMWDLHRGGL